MDTTRPRVDEHPLLAAVLGAHDLLIEHATTPTWSLDADSTTRLVQASAALLATASELEARVIAHAGVLDLAGAGGMQSTAAWLARTTTITQPTAHAKVRLAQVVGLHEATRAALARGAIHAEQAIVITRAVDLLRDDQTVVSPEDQARAETHLLAEAVDHDARSLGVLGGRLFEVLDPAGADAHEARALERQEDRARATTSLTLRDDGEGLTRGSFAMPTAQASMLRKALLALAAPKAIRAREGAGSYVWDKPTPARLGAAFVEYVERYPTSQLPKVGGLSATVVAVGDLDIFLGKVKAARLDTGVMISHAQLVRMACEAGVVPAWMDTTTGKTLSLGRRHRFHRPHQRLALLLERETCEHPGCQTSAWLCHIHHRVPWTQGGTTDTVTAVVLCPFHHHRAHAAGTSYPMRT